MLGNQPRSIDHKTGVLMSVTSVEPELTFEIETHLKLGESLYWAAEEKALYFVDITAPALFRLDTVTRDLKRWAMPSDIGSFGMGRDGRLAVALRDGVYWFDPKTEHLDLLVRPEPDRPMNRLNDGKVGPDGCFWVGSMDDRPEKEKTGALYRIDIGGQCTRMLDGLIISNGLAWTPDGRTMYHADSRGPFAQAFDFDPHTGALSRQRILRVLPEAEGRPDGAACDAEGFYWVAGVTAGCINRIAPDGRLDRTIKLPPSIPAPTMPCFGGADMKTLYVTSLAKTVDGVTHPGRLFSFQVDVAGAKVGRFGDPVTVA
jgi:sugar lactone lactonase YvrE